MRHRARELPREARSHLDRLLRALSVVVAACTCLFILQLAVFVVRIVEYRAFGQESAQRAFEEANCDGAQSYYSLCQSFSTWLPELVPCTCMMVRVTRARTLLVVIGTAVTNTVAWFCVCRLQMLMWQRDSDTSEGPSAVRKLGVRFFHRTKLRSLPLRPSNGAFPTGSGSSQASSSASDTGSDVSDSGLSMSSGVGPATRGSADDAIDTSVTSAAAKQRWKKVKKKMGSLAWLYVDGSCPCVCVCG